MIVELTYVQKKIRNSVEILWVIKFLTALVLLNILNTVIVLIITQFLLKTNLTLEKATIAVSLKISIL